MSDILRIIRDRLGLGRGWTTPKEDPHPQLKCTERWEATIDGVPVQLESDLVDGHEGQHHSTVVYWR